MMLAHLWQESLKSMVEILIKALREDSPRSINTLTQIARKEAWFCQSYRSNRRLAEASKRFKKLTGHTRASYLISRVPHQETHRRTVSLPRSPIELSLWFAPGTWQVATDRVRSLLKTSSSANSSISSSLLAWLRMRSKLRLRAMSKFLKRTIQTRSESWKSRMRKRNDV